MTHRPPTRGALTVQERLMGLRVVRVRRVLCSIWHRWQQRRRLQRDRVQLHAMDERELRDLGLGRDGIEHSLRTDQRMKRPPCPTIVNSTK